MLDERKTAILRAVVQEYIATAQPVGSTHIANAPGVAASARPRSATRWPCSSRRATSPSRTRRPAASPPTRATASSSTTWPRRGRLDAVASAAGRRVLRRGPRPPRGDAAPDHQPARAAHPQRRRRRRPASGERPSCARCRSCALSPRTATVVVGAVQRHGRERDHRAADRHVRRRARRGHRPPPAPRSSGRVARRRGGRRRRGDRRLDDDLRARPCGAVSRHRPRSRVFVGGASVDGAGLRRGRDGAPGAAHARAAVRRWCRWCATSLDRGLSVAIGAEHGIEPLAACSVVVAPVVVDGEQVGTVGVLGPTRMDYPQALATVEVGERPARPPAE